MLISLFGQVGLAAPVSGIVGSVAIFYSFLGLAYYASTRMLEKSKICNPQGKAKLIKISKKNIHHQLKLLSTNTSGIKTAISSLRSRSGKKEIAVWYKKKSEKDE